MKYIIYTFSLILIISAFSPSDIWGIPAFARKYNMSCQTCHSPFPRLKDYGDEYARNGFVLADKDAPRYFIETGDMELNLIRDVPVAFRLDGFATFKNKDNQSKFEFSFPRVMKILSGGSLSKNLAYYFYFYLSEKGEIVGLEDAYLMFNNVFNSELDIYFGQFQVCDPLFKREIRLTLEDYEIYAVKPGTSRINLGYDRGIMFNLPLPSKTDLTLMVLNGSGLNKAENEDLDLDNFNNLFGRVSQDFNEFFRLGAAMYYGKEKLLDNHLNWWNKVLIYGGDLTFSFDDKIEFNFQYLKRNDDQPSLQENNLKIDGLFLETIFTPKGDESKIYFAGLFNYLNSNYNIYDYRAFALNTGYLLKRNIRLIGELKYDFKLKGTQFSFGFSSAW